MKKEETPLFVGITGKNELRKSMLECSKDILELMKEHENFKSTRLEKTKLLSQLRSEVREITRLLNQIRNVIPKVSGNTETKKPEPKAKPIKIEKTEKTEIEKLEDELAMIESKLNSIT